MTDKKEDIKKEQQVYTYNDLIKFENPQAYSSLGKVPLSGNLSAPKFSFGSADRGNQAKLYHNKDLAKIDFAGKTSPGPVYDVRGTDQFYYQIDGQTKFTKDARNTLGTGPKYDFYLRKDVDVYQINEFNLISVKKQKFEPHDADKFRREKAPIVRIGLDSRFPIEKRLKGTPGPQYDPKIKPEVPLAPKFSFGFRRDIPGASPLAPTTSTPVIVGPGAYLQKPAANPSNIEDQPAWSIGKGPKFAKFFEGWDKNQTYDYKQRAVGNQVNSRKQTLPSFSVGKGSRDAKVGHFKDIMAKQPTRVRIEHPKI